MRSKKVTLSFIFLMVFLIIFSISTKINTQESFGIGKEDINIDLYNLKQAGFWNNFTFIHITGSNWTTAKTNDWCSGMGTWSDPYLIENMLINASDSPIGCGIFIENSLNVYFTIENVTIFGSSNGIKLENTNNGALIGNVLSNNLDSGINMINSVNNTLLRNTLVNNGLCGINLTSNCNNNRILENTAKNEGTNVQDTGIHLRSFCDNNEILGNLIYDNNVYGINIEDYCEENVVINNTIKNVATNQQDYGIRLHNDCHQSTIAWNIIEDLNSYAIYMVTSDQNSVTNNQLINCGSGMYMLIDLQSTITSNTISGGSYGIIMSACDGGEIAYNFINETGNFAIRIYINSDNNVFYNNIIKDNTNLGIQLDDPSDTNNAFYKNSFISNGIHAYDNGTSTSWDNSVIGNYWDDYTGEDLDYDNIGDTPYNILGAANANDTLPIYDHWSPIFIINTPLPSSYAESAPQFNLFVNLTYIYSMWYTISGDGSKHYFTENGTINQSAWNALNEGNLLITFYCRDIAWDLYFNSVIVTKDTSNPVISIISPTEEESFNTEAPNFVIEISDSWSPIDSMWYTINYGVIKYYFAGNNTIDQGAWTALIEGNVIITFYVRDAAWNVGSISVNLIKDTSTSPGDTPPIDFNTVIIISVIAVGAIVLAGILIRRSKKTSILPKKSKFLNEDQLVEAQYFKDITSILIILAIHKESGLALSKIALHGGTGLDENLFTGFISAIGSFKNELAKQMGLRVKDEGGGNVIEYNEFTITLMDGEYLRLGLVSNYSLGKLIKEKCEKVLRSYEVKHINDLKNFDGDLQLFNDFKEIIEAGLDMNLCKKCTINLKQLNKYNAPNTIIEILNKFKLKPEGFYPAEISIMLTQETKISEQEANLIVYEAYKNQVISPLEK